MNGAVNRGAKAKREVTRRCPAREVLWGTATARQTLTARGEKAEVEARSLMEEVLRRENVMAAYKRVVANGGAPGVDGMTVQELMGYREHWPRIREEIRSGAYRPQPVKTVEIPKPGGKGTRMLGIPTVLDRMIQQALLQALSQSSSPRSRSGASASVLAELREAGRVATAEAALPAMAAVEAALDPAGEAHRTGLERGASQRLRLQWPRSLVERRCLAYEPSHPHSTCALMVS
jgi:hypothetical protein